MWEDLVTCKIIRRARVWESFPHQANTTMKIHQANTILTVLLHGCFIFCAKAPFLEIVVLRKENLCFSMFGLHMGTPTA